MKRGWVLALLALFLVAGLVGTSYAEVKLGGELRLRGVMVDNGDSTAALKDGGFFEQRTRLNADASVDENAKVFLQVQDSRKWGSESSTTDTGASTSTSTTTTCTGLPCSFTDTNTDTKGVDLSQGYVELGKLFGQPLSVKIGRQAMFYGEHRLIGHLEWSNNARRFDAIKFTYKHDVVDVDFWTAKVTEAGADWGNDGNFNGIYASLKNIPKNAVDLYLLQKIASSGDANFYTIGGRVKGAVENFNVDYTAEVAMQSGDATATTSQDASAYAIRVGYTLADMMGLRVGIEYDAATGEDTATTDVEKFDNLYPTNHYLYGYTDDVDWTDMKAWAVSVSLKPMDKVTASLEYWNYEKEASGDDNGTELNVKLNHEMSKNINCEAAYVIRDAGDVAATSYGGYGTIPADKSATFGYFMINVKFM
ncbi:MAG: alginate export family protein [Nitrospirae bacterium]|nr:alginate export family protein [Nitrospirota bacterium]